MFTKRLVVGNRVDEGLDGRSRSVSRRCRHGQVIIEVFQIFGTQLEQTLTVKTIRKGKPRRKLPEKDIQPGVIVILLAQVTISFLHQLNLGTIELNHGSGATLILCTKKCKRSCRSWQRV